MGTEAGEGRAVVTNSMELSLRKLQEIVKDREAWHDVVHGVVIVNCQRISGEALDTAEPRLGLTAQGARKL